MCYSHKYICGGYGLFRVKDIKYSANLAYSRITKLGKRKDALNECHVANSGNWLVIWSSNDEVAFFERTGSHDELF